MYSNNGNKFFKQIGETIGLWIVIPVGSKLINDVYASLQKLPTSDQAGEFMNKTADLATGLLYQLQPSFGSLLIDLAFIGLGALTSVAIWGRLGGVIATAIGIFIAMWISSVMQ